MHSTPAARRLPRRQAIAIVATMLLAAAASSACAAPAATPSPPPMATPDATTLNRATTAAWVAAVRAKDAAAVAALYAPDATFDDPPEHRPDRAGVQATYEEVFGYGQMAVDPAVILVGAEGAVVSWVYAWCNASIAPCPSPQVSRATGVSVLRMTDGIVTNETLYYVAGGEPN